MKIAGVIIAGGRSARMGSEKAIIPMGGRRLIDRVHERVAPQVDRLVINTNGDGRRFPGLDVFHLPDILTDIGTPLAGLHAGLRWARKEHFDALLSVPCDCPFLPEDLVTRLAEAGARAAIARSGAQDHVLTGLWNCELADRLDIFLSGGRHRVKDWAHDCGAVAVEWPLDPYDPFANMALGRSLMQGGVPDDGIVWMDRSVSLSPSFAKGHYSRGLIDCLAGRTDEARLGVDLAIGLSPLDPLLAPMLMIKAYTFMMDGEYAAARDLSLRAVRITQSHYHVVATAAITCHLAGDRLQAAHWAQHLLDQHPDASATLVLRMNYASEQTRATIRGALNALGIPD